MKLWIMALALAVSACAHTEKKEQKPEAPAFTSGHAPVNGIQMYYEIHGKGEGEPLVLIHGGGSTIEVTWSKLLPILSKNRKIIAVEEQGHGRTSDRDKPVSFEQTADDVAALIKHLNVAKADVFGFSNGATSALQVAIRHPELVRKLIFASAFTRRNGAPDGFWKFMKNADFSNMPQPLKEAYLKVNPDPAKLRAMHDKDLARMKNFKDFPNRDVQKVKAQTLVMMGDQDVVKPEHAVELTQLIKGARLVVLPGGHGDYLGELVMTQRPSRYPEITAGIVEEFLDLPQPATSVLEIKQ